MEIQIVYFVYHKSKIIWPETRVNFLLLVCSGFFSQRVIYCESCSVFAGLIKKIINIDTEMIEYSKTMEWSSFIVKHWWQLSIASKCRKKEKGLRVASLFLLFLCFIKMVGEVLMFWFWWKKINLSNQKICDS